MTRTSRVSLIALLFSANGLGGPSFLARLPERQRDLGLSEGQLGLVVAGFALGAGLASLFAGRLIERAGSRTVAIAAAATLGVSMWSAGAAPNAPALFAALAFIGAADAVMDTSMNANGALYEHVTGHSVMHRLHAAWSLGALSAAGVASAAAGLEIGLGVHLAVIGTVIVAIAVFARSGLPEGRVVHEPVPADDGSAPAGAAGGARVRRWGWMRGVAVLAGATVAGAMLEGVPSDWAAVRIEQFGVSSWVPALGFAAFMAGMLAGRSVGDHLTDRYGRAEVLRVGTALGAVGFLLAALVTQPVIFMAGLAAAGVGVSAFFPLAFSAASRTPGVAPGVGAAAVSLSARIGFLVEPVIVGSLAEVVGLRWGFVLVAVVAVGLSVAAPRIVPRSSGSSRPPRAQPRASDPLAAALQGDRGDSG